MTRFARHPERTLADLAREAALAALADAGCDPAQIELAIVGNALGGIMTGQESVRGQVVLAGLGLRGVPIVNVDNACASSSTALGVAVDAIRAGRAERVLVVGVEKMYDADRSKTIAALAGAGDARTASGADASTRSPFMEIYAERVRRYMSAWGLDASDLARVAAKNRGHAVHNPYAQYRAAVTVEDVLAAPMVAAPLTRLMCSPISDGAAAVVVMSERAAGAAARNVAVRASVLVSGTPDVDAENEDVVARAAALAYGQAGIEPRDVDVIEVHDAASSGELLAYAALGLCEVGDEARLVRGGGTTLGGAIPVNPSGGLQGRGNPSGATGLAQIAELVWQLRGDAGNRAVAGARIALAENAGGTVRDRTAAVCIHVLGA
jgi:acetyl-CoA acetyltransferase